MTFSFFESGVAQNSGILHTRPREQPGGDPGGPVGRAALRGCCRAGGSEPHRRGRSRMNRVAVVTGAASGMGLGIARRLASAGNRVALLDLDGDGAASAAAAIGAGALAAKVDVTDRGGVDDAMARVRAELGP